MINLLTETLSAAEIAAVLRQSTPSPLLPPFGSPVWAEVAARPSLQDWLAKLKTQASDEVGQPLPALTDDLYARFRLDGNRTAFQAPYFERRVRFARATLCALLFPEEAQWLPEAIRIGRTIMEEVSWALPAHVVSPTGKDPGCIDLFSAETAEEFGSLVALFGEALPADLTAAIKTRVRAEITDHFRTVYARKEHPGAHWVQGAGNWNAVCHQGVVGATLYLEDDLDVVADVLHQTTLDLPMFLASFTADGGCSEGPGYWNYGFGRFSWLNQQLETYTGGRLSLMDSDPRMTPIASFARRLSLESGRMINFADCGQYGRPNAPLSAYLGERLDDPANRQQAQISYAHSLSNVPGERLFEMLHYVLYCPPHVDFEARAASEDYYFPDLQVIFAQGRDAAGRQVVFAAKGGHNAELHNHNDCGSFLFYRGRAGMALEIGAPEYTRQLFSAERYTFLATGSFGHSVPLINGCEQKAGVRFAARVLESVLTDEEARFALDLTAAYPEDAACDEARRTLTFDKTHLSLEVTDSFILREARTLETALITEAEAALQSDGSALMIKDGQQMRVVPGADTVISEIQTHIYPDHGGHPQSVRRLVFTPRLLSTNVTLSYTLLSE